MPSHCKLHPSRYQASQHPTWPWEERKNLLPHRFWAVAAVSGSHDIDAYSSENGEEAFWDSWDAYVLLSEYGYWGDVEPA
jgi:hypothetical protein